MESVVGSFHSRADAEQAYQDLQRTGHDPETMTFLTPEAPQEIAEVPTTPGEERGMGKAINTVLGAAIGGGAGLGLGSALASLFVPGVGPILAAGIGAAALLGAGGAVAGASLGDKAEADLDNGMAMDDVPRLRELLRLGRTLIVVSVKSADEAEQVRALFNTYGADRFAQRGEDDKAA